MNNITFSRKISFIVNLFIYSICNSIIALLVSLISKKIINGIINSDIKEISSITDVYLPLTVISIMGLFLSKYLFMNISNKNIGDLQKSIYTKINYLDLNKTHIIENGSFLTYISKDLETISNYIRIDIIDFFDSLFMLLAMSAISIWFDWRIFIFTMVCSAVYALTLFFAKKMKECDQSLRTEHKNSTNIINQIFIGLPIINYYPGCMSLFDSFCDNTENIMKLEDKKAKVMGLFSLLALGSNMVREIGIIIICPLILKLDLGTTMAMINISSYLNSTFASLGEGVLNLQRVMIALGHVREALEMPVEQQRNPDDCQFQKVELRKVSYSYDNKSESVSQLSYVINSGDMVGITGNIGSGKSTFLKLVAGIYLPQKGQLLLNDVVIGDKNVINLRKQISYVDQDYNLFENSLRENIRCFDSSIDDGEIWDCLAQVNLESWARQLPLGLDTKVGRTELNPSGGERQRISIIRALLKKGELLIIDEPTSSLDADNEIIIRNLIGKEKGKRAIVIISHREQTLKDVDKIIQMDSGIIAEEYDRKTLRK